MHMGMRTSLYCAQVQGLDFVTLPPPTSTTYLKPSLLRPAVLWEFLFSIKKRKHELLVHWFHMTLGFINQKKKKKDSVTYVKIS